MNNKQSEQVKPGEVNVISDAEAAVNAMRVAMANREAVMKSFTETREQVMKLLEVRSEEALKPMMQAKVLLQQAHTSAGLSDAQVPPHSHREESSDVKATPADSRQRLHMTLNNAFTVLLALQGAGGVAADTAREQAITGIADALAELVETEVDKLVQC